ncbi:MAG: cytochrome c-type biogenesis protein CcmH [Thermoleophilia bacterium]|nr:cytochrome c-type biogenesis protein CcmH [Thermoleophilia bacterium]
MKTALAIAAVLASIPAILPGTAFAAEPAGGGGAAPQTSLPQLEGEVMCPTCGTLLELSHAPAAERERAFIRKLIAEGKSEDQIKDALVAEYGSGALALPDDDSINFYAYLLPLLVFAAGLGGVIWGVIRWRRNRESAADDVGPPSGPDSDDEARLERDMARFDL